MQYDFNKDDEASLSRVLARIGAKQLGDGDVSAGANYVVSQLVAVANLYPPGAGVLDAALSHHPAGSSLVTVGGITSSLIRDKGHSMLSHYQNKISRHHGAWLSHLQREQELPLPMRSSFGLNMVAPGKVPKVAEFLNSFEGLQPNISGLLNGDAYTHRREFHFRPTVYISATSTKQLTAELGRSHDGRPIVRFRPRDLTSCSEFEDILGGLNSGSLSLPGMPGLTLWGFIFAEVPDGVAGHLVAAGGHRASWMT
ncbi:MAG: hypothetical protein EOP85_22305, partial [Verrucomicrobiaceae bacterium]